MPTEALHSAVSALSALSTAQAVTANNIANVNTPEFDPSRVMLEDRPDYGGVALADIQTQEVQGALVEPAPPAPAESGDVPPHLVEASGTDLATEMVNLIENERAFEANAAVVRTADEMLGYVVDELV